jgi:chitodextrinase
MQLRALVLVAAAATCVALGTSDRAEAAIANADTYVNAVRPHANFGDRTYLRVGDDPVTHGYVRFTLRQEVPASASVILRVYVSRAGSSRIVVHRVRGQRWREDEITYANAPRPRRTIASGRPKAGTWLLLDVSSAVHRRGSYTFAITAASRVDSSRVALTSRSTDSATYLGAGKRVRKARLVLDTAAPTTPTGLTVSTFTPTSISFEWQASADDTGVRGYDVYENGTKIAQVAGTSATISGLTCETSFSFTVAAYDAAGNTSGESAPLSATTGACDTQPPSQPTGLAVTPLSASEIFVSWSPSQDNVGIAGYAVLANGANPALVASPSATVTRLSCDTSYSFTVIAYDVAGNRSPPSDPVSAKTSTCPVWFGTLNTLPAKASLEAAAGINIAEVDVGWDLYEPQDGVFDSNYASSIAQKVRSFRAAGYKVVLGLALHYPPSWVFSYPNSRLVNQYGGTADEVNLIFNDRLRQKAAALMTRLKADVGLDNFYAIRISSGGDAEAMYPSEDADGIHSNGYWAYDTNAQGGAELPPTIPVNPFPGWQPGQTTYRGRPFTRSDVEQWYSWYLDALLDAVDWQIQTYKKLGYGGYFQVLTPGLGSRPAEYETAITSYLSGAGNSNGTMGRGAVWQKWYERLPDKANVMAYVSSLADWSGNPTNNVCQATDNSVSLADPQINDWSAARWISYNAKRFNLPTSGENPGGGQYYGLTMIQTAAKQMQACGMDGMYWAHDANLYDGTSGVTLQNYADTIAQYR